MARPPKAGLLYFPKDVDYYDDFKIMDLINEYGPLGQTIYDIVVSSVYHEGYFLEVELDKLAFKVIRIIGNKWVESKNLVRQVIYYCAEIGLFHKDLLRRNIVTSVGIQRRYAKATVRNKVQTDKYWLIDEDGQPLPQMSLTDADMEVSATETPESDKERK